MLALTTATIVDGSGLTRIHAKTENVAMMTPTTVMILSTAFIQLIARVTELTQKNELTVAIMAYNVMNARKSENVVLIIQCQMYHIVSLAIKLTHAVLDLKIAPTVDGWA